MSAAGSRSMMNATVGRRFSWAICPSTQTVPSLSTYFATRVETARTGQGLSGDLPGSASVIFPARWGGHLAVARVILLDSSVWKGARALVASSYASSASRSATRNVVSRARTCARVSDS